MRTLILLLAVSTIAGCTSYRSLHRNALVIDTHNDILSAVFEKKTSFDKDLRGITHSDLNRFPSGGVDAQVFAIWCDGDKKNPYRYANEQIDTLMATINRNPSKVRLVKNSTELTSAVANKKLAALIGVEGGHMIEEKLENLDALYNRGVRYMTLTWNNSTPWATSAATETSRSFKEDVAKNGKRAGLSAFGKQVVRRMNELGMLVDVSHVGEQTFWDVINTTTKPIIASHSCAYTLCPGRRNLKDDQIKAIAKNGGVIHLNFYSGFVDSTFERKISNFFESHKAEGDSLMKNNMSPSAAGDYVLKKYDAEQQLLRPSINLLMDHVNYIVKLVGADHVGLGSDFDGITSTPKGLDDITQLSNITKELVKRGYSKKDIRKILGENFIRVLKANESR